MLDPGIFCVPRNEPVTSSGWRPRRGKDLLVPRALGKFFPSLVRSQYRAQSDSMSLKFFKMLQNYKNRYLSRIPAQQVARIQENLRSPGALSENKNRRVKKYNNMQTGCL